MLASVGLTPAAAPRGVCRGKQPSSSTNSRSILCAGSGVPTTSMRGRTHTAASRRRRIRVMTRATDGGEGGEGVAPKPSASDALAERMAKAKAYKESLQTPGSKSEMEGAIKEALSSAPAPPKREVSVTIMTKDDNYNPFDEDEKAVGFETRDNAGQAVAGQRKMQATTSMG